MTGFYKGASEAAKNFAALSQNAHDKGQLELAAQLTMCSLLCQISDTLQTVLYRVDEIEIEVRKHH